MFLEKDEAVFDCFPSPELWDLIITAVVPAAAPQYAGEAHDRTFEDTVFEYGIYHVGGAGGVVEAAASKEW